MSGNFVPITQEVLNSLTIGVRYTVISSASIFPAYGIAYKAENGNTYLDFGDVPVYRDWKIKL